jgi:gamma-glutamylputrescine oxidase
MRPSHPGEAPGYYEASAGPRPGPVRLEDTVRADVCVIGAGFSGLSAALHLAERGYRVVVLEAERVGYGASGRNGGQVGSGQRRDVDMLERSFGRDTARLLWDMAEEAKGLVRSRIEGHGIDCDYRPGNLLGITRARFVRGIAEEAEHLARHYDYAHLEMLSLGQVRSLVDTADYVAGRLDHGGGHLHPLRFALGLARAARQAGAVIHESSPVTAIQWATPNRIRTPAGEVQARYVLVCTNAYTDPALEPRMSGRVLPIVNHVLATAPLGEARARALIPAGCCVHSTRFVVDYYRLSEDGRLVFGGGETYGARPPPDLKGFVRRYMLRVFPQLHDAAIHYAWSGWLAVSMDRMPEFGRIGDSGYFVQGFSGHGVALTQLAGRLLAEAVDGDASRFDVFARIPHRRFPGGPWLRHPLMVAGMLWYALRDRIG